MKKWFFLFICCCLLLIGCSNEKKVSTNGHTKISIEPYSLSDKEESLMMYAGVSQIEFFQFDGELGQKDDLEFKIEHYKKGKFKGELTSMSNMVESKYKNTLFSFAIDNNIDYKRISLKLIMGTPSGIATTNFSNNMKGYSFESLVNERITLKKNKPVYLAAWYGTSENHLSSPSSKNGELPQGIQDVEETILYSVVWKAKDK